MSSNVSRLKTTWRFPRSAIAGAEKSSETTERKKKKKKSIPFKWVHSAFTRHPPIWFARFLCCPIYKHLCTRNRQLMLPALRQTKRRGWDKVSVWETVECIKISNAALLFTDTLQHWEPDWTRLKAGDSLSGFSVRINLLLWNQIWTIIVVTIWVKYLKITEYCQPK